MPKDKDSVEFINIATSYFLALKDRFIKKWGEDRIEQARSNDSPKLIENRIALKACAKALQEASEEEQIELDLDLSAFQNNFDLNLKA